jgi:hypothetical protein
LGSASFSIGTEAGDQITVGIQLKYGNGGDLAARGYVKAYLSSDANGDVMAASPQGVAIGTDGLLIPKTGVRPTGLITKGTLVIDAVPEKFKTTTTATYNIAGVTYTKTAATAILFTAAHTVTASKFGIILIQINAAGTVSTKVPAATQAYNSAALALAALPAPDAGKAMLGYIAIANNALDWVANTDDLTAASDVTTATFTDADEITTVPTCFDLTSEADGDIDVVITEARVRTYYLNLIMPDGSVVTSGAIAFV